MGAGAGSAALGALAARAPAVLLAKSSQETAAASEAQFIPLDVRQVKVGGEMGRRIAATVSNNLLVIDVDRDFLSPFRRRDRDGGYIGLGKLIDSIVRLAAHTGDKALLARKHHVVQAILATQEPDGYIGLMKPEARMWKLWDVHEMAYLVSGLVSDYQLFGEKPSLEAARQVADYIVRHWRADPYKDQVWLDMAVTGLEPAMLAVHQATGDVKYLDFVVHTRRVAEWHKYFALGRGRTGSHAYVDMCRCLAQLRIYALQPDPRLLEPSQCVFDFITRRDGMLVTGAVSTHERWHDTQDGKGDLGETCSTAYLLRVLDQHLRRVGDPLCGDLMERIILNTLFAAQSPDGRRLRYYTPLEGPRKYFHRDTYCCPCNYRRIVAELPAMIYYRSGRGIVVNLYTASSAKVPLDNRTTVSLEQETDYPSQGEVGLRVDPTAPQAFALALRIPRWCPSATVRVNGQRVGAPVRRGEFLAIERTWRAGDRVELSLPMKWRLVKGRKMQAGRVAILRGPQVFCLGPDAAEKLESRDLNSLVIDPGTLEGPMRDATVRPEGIACRVRAWRAAPGSSGAKPDVALTLREFPDPAGEATYFRVPDANDPALVTDEVFVF